MTTDDIAKLEREAERATRELERAKMLAIRKKAEDLEAFENMTSREQRELYERAPALYRDFMSELTDRNMERARAGGGVS